MTLKRITAFFTAAALAFLPAAQVLAETNNGEVTEEKQYVIIAENEAVYDTVAEEVEEDITVETPVLSENNVIVAELDEAEAEELEKRGDIVIEEDIILSGCTLAEDTDSTEEMTPEEAIQKKAEMKRMKQERLAEMEQETEEAGTEEALEYEWNIQAVNADEVLEDSAENVQAVRVAVLDSGVDYSTGINQKGYVNFIEGEEELSPVFQDGSGHGTGIASIISGNGKTGIYGVSPDADLYSVKVLDDENKAPLSRIIRGIYWCIENDMDIINMSFGTAVYSKALEQAVKDAYQAGLLMVGAAGNGSGAVEYPAAFPEVMAVASVNPEAEISEFSNTGEELDVAAPGEKVCVSSFFEGNTVTHGTSIAVPHVAGTAALLWAKDKSKSNEFIRQLIDYSAKDIEGTDDCGLLDVAYALSVYDEFAESFNENQDVPEENIPENTQTPESFEDVADDEAYVEGRWKDTVHADMVGAVSAGFSAAAINLIKTGIQYPDLKESGWKFSAEHPRWHGKWKTAGGKKLNYVAVLEMISEIAMDGGVIESSYNDINGMTKNLYNNLKADIVNIQAAGGYLYGYSKTNKKYFLFGCALHGMTDAFAHSSADSSNKEIYHTNPGAKDDADTISNYRGRYDMACQFTKYAMQSLKEGRAFCDGYEVLQAIKSQYVEGTTKFKLINIKRYVTENGPYDNAVLDKINLSKSVSD